MLKFEVILESCKVFLTWLCIICYLLLRHAEGDRIRGYKKLVSMEILGSYGIVCLESSVLLYVHRITQPRQFYETWNLNQFYFMETISLLNKDVNMCSCSAGGLLSRTFSSLMRVLLFLDAKNLRFFLRLTSSFTPLVSISKCDYDFCVSSSESLLQT